MTSQKPYIGREEGKLCHSSPNQ